MYRLRAFQQKDWEDLRRLHAVRGFGFPVPERLEEAIVVEDEETGKVVQIIGSRLTREMYTWIDPEWQSPRWRWDAFEQAHQALRAAAKAKGVIDVKMWTEHRGFARKLVKKLGWKQISFPSFNLDL
jgi:hypothetical protein